MISRYLLCLHLTISFIRHLGVQVVLADQVNITVDDTDPTVLYTPSESWRPSSVACPTCLNPDAKDAFMNTYHDGTHLSPPPDEDDKEGGGELRNLVNEQEERRSVAAPDRGKGGSGDADRDRDVAVSAHFNFSGSAIYLYCIQPLGIPPVGTAPTFMNLTFTLDNHRVGNFSHPGAKSATGYTSHVNVFTRTHLTEALHVLRVDVGVGSVFLFDYLIYTHDNQNGTSSNPPALNETTSNPPAHNETTPSAPTPNTDEHTKKHNIATFAGAIGGSVGVLGVLSLCLALSIMKRRRNYNRRERLARDRPPLLPNASDDSPPMIGPAPFIPRFFPGTQIPSIYTDPPSYVESISKSSPLSPPPFDVAIAAGGSHISASVATSELPDSNSTSPNSVLSSSSSRYLS